MGRGIVEVCFSDKGKTWAIVDSGDNVIIYDEFSTEVDAMWRAA